MAVFIQTTTGQVFTLARLPGSDRPATAARLEALLQEGAGRPGTLATAEGVYVAPAQIVAFEEAEGDAPARLHARGVCECCGRIFAERTRRRPAVGTAWVWVLAPHAETGVCPACHVQHGMLGGHERPWSSADWAAHIGALGPAEVEEVAAAHGASSSEIKAACRERLAALEEELVLAIQDAATVDDVAGLEPRVRPGWHRARAALDARRPDIEVLLGEQIDGADSAADVDRWMQLARKMGCGELAERAEAREKDLVARAIAAAQSVGEIKRLQKLVQARGWKWNEIKGRVA